MDYSVYFISAPAIATYCSMGAAIAFFFVRHRKNLGKITPKKDDEFPEFKVQETDKVQGMKINSEQAKPQSPAPDLPDDQKQILTQLQKGPLTAVELGELLKITPLAAGQALSCLRRKELVTRNGSKKWEAAKQAEQVMAKPGIFPAMIFTETGIKFSKIPERLGTPVELDPSMPVHGAMYMAVETPEGFKAYDPRDVPVVMEETPQAAFDATHCFEYVNAVYANKAGFWEKVNTVLLWVFLVGLFLVTIYGLDKIAQ